MQISGNSSAIRALNRIDATQRAPRAVPHGGRGTGDTVSISDEAKAAYLGSLGKSGAGLEDGAADTGAKFRRALHDAWNESHSEEATLMGKLRAAITS